MAAGTSDDGNFLQDRITHMEIQSLPNLEEQSKQYNLQSQFYYDPAFISHNKFLKPFSKTTKQDVYGLLKESVVLGKVNVFSRLLKNCEDSFLHNQMVVHRYSNVNDLLRLAVQNGHCEITEKLLSRGGDVNIRFKGFSLIYMAVTVGSTDLVKLLVHYQADLHTVDNKGENLLFALIMSELNTKQKEQLLRYLLDSGVNPEHVSKTGKHPLHIAAIYSGGCLIELANRGCDVNVCDNILGDTPLHVACKRCCEETILPLLISGAKINIHNKLGQTPLEKLLSSASGTDFHSKTRRDLARRLIMFGFRVAESSQLHSVKLRQRKILEVIKRLTTNQLNIPSLKCLSRVEIRNHISGVYFSQNIDQLELPAVLKQYLCFHEEAVLQSRLK